MNAIRKVERWIGHTLAALLPRAAARAFAARLAARDPQTILEAVGPQINPKPHLDDMPFDLPVEGPLRFEHLAGLFASTSLDHSIISMTIRQTAYLYGLVQQLKARKVIEIGRYKGGSTLVIAAAMNGEGKFWSIDVGAEEARLTRGRASRPYDAQITDMCRRFGLKVELITGDSRAVELETGEVDLVFIDGDHSYDGVRADFERFGTRVRLGGAVLFDDAADEGVFRTPHSPAVGRVVREIIAGGDFRLVKTVNRLAHLERIRPLARS